MNRSVILAVSNVCRCPTIIQGRARRSGGDWMRKGGVVGCRTSQKLGSNPVRHSTCLRYRWDGAVAHRPQVGILAVKERKASFRIQTILWDPVSFSKKKKRLEYRHKPLSLHCFDQQVRLQSTWLKLLYETFGRILFYSVKHYQYGQHQNYKDILLMYPNSTPCMVHFFLHNDTHTHTLQKHAYNNYRSLFVITTEY